MSKFVRALIERAGCPTRHAAGLLVLALVGGLSASGYASAGEAVSPVRGDLTVDQAVRLALERNQDLLTSGENINAASGQQKQALQLYLPRISAGAAWSHNFNTTAYFSQTTGTVIPGDADDYGVRWVLSQNLIDIASIRTISAAGKELEASKFQHQFSRADLVLGTKQQYYVLLAAQELASVNDSALVLSERELKRTESLFELGMVAKSDVLKAQVQVSNSKLDVIRSHGNVIDERAKMARVLGQSPTDDLRAADRLTETPVVVDSTAIFQEAVVNRADLQAALSAWEASKLRASAAKAGFLPTISGQIAYANGNAGGFQPFAGFDDRTRSAVIGLNFPLLDGVVGKKGQVQTAQARAEQDRYAYEKKKLDVEVEVRGAINTARQANEGVDVARSGLVSSEEDLKLSQEKYNVGSGTILDLIDSQVALQRARSNYVQALTLVRIAEASLERVRGRTY